MQKYKPRTPLASVADRILRMLIAAGLGIAWFVWLWGLSLPALTAGLAYGGLLWLCARLFGKKSVEKREKQMRRMIGGELALSRLLTLPPRHAAFQAALWISPKEPVSMQKAVDWGVLGTLEGKSALVRLIAQHESLPVNVQQVIEAVRETRRQEAELCILCLTAPIAREARQYAESCEIPIRLIERDAMIDLAGLCSPATDEDLSRLGKRKQTRRSPKEWLSIVLDASKAKRYFWYGLGLSALALLTGQGYYPLPAGVCLGLFAMCKLRQLHQARGA